MAIAPDEIDGVAEVQCQRTRRFIPMRPLETAVVCPWCDEHETYQRLEPEHEAWHHVQRAIQMCRIEFGIPDDEREAVVWLGDHPETVFESHLDRHNIYLGRDSDRWQFMYSGSHEAFHRVCGERKNAMHWADEMFAVFFSLLYLERIGETAHADRNRIGLINDSRLHRTQLNSLDAIGPTEPDSAPWTPSGATHNPSVAGSSPARPIKHSVVLPMIRARPCLTPICTELGRLRTTKVVTTKICGLSSVRSALSLMTQTCISY
jgi:hypothetical protein